MPVTWSNEKLILLYCPCRGSNSRPSAHRSFKHDQGVPRPLPLGHRNIRGRPNVRLEGARGIEKQSLQNNYHISNDIHFGMLVRKNEIKL